MSDILKVFSGEFCKCDCGIPVKAFSTYGDEIELHTGDIVITWRGEYVGTDSEFWFPCDGLTCVVADQYQSYSNGKIEALPEIGNPYVMGIKSCGFDDLQWRVQLVKKWHDVVAGEKWPQYGFNYREFKV